MPSLSSFTRRILGLATALALALVTSLAAEQREYTFTDETAEALPKFKAAMEAKPKPDIATALAVLNALEAKVPADSYDAAYIQQWKSGIYIQQGDYAKAVEPIERSLAMSESKTPSYFDERQSRELYFFLVQLYFQEGTQTKNVTLAAANFDKAEKAMVKWLKLTPQSTVDGQMIYAQLLLSRAMLNPDKPDLALVKRTLEQVEIGLRLSSRPKDTFYVLKLVCLQQLDQLPESAELLELLLKQKPDNSAYWSQLAAIYLTLAGNYDGKDQQLSQIYSTRAIVTFERAQSHGLMNAVKDNNNLVAIYFNMGQYERAAELLDAGLKSGSVENDTKNWELLALCYQQLQRPLKGVEALKEGTKAFPKSGQLEYQIGTAYTTLEKPAEALPHFQAAVAKGNLTRPHQAWLALSYAAYSVQKYDIALEAAKKAGEFPEGAKDGKNMQKALEDLLKDREAKKNKT